MSRAAPTTALAPTALTPAAALALAAMLAAAPAAAQEGGAIRSGEHVGFSRIVLNVEPTTEWSLELEPRRATVVFPGKELAFTTGGLFVRMPRTRILAVDAATAPAGTAVAIQLGCDCRVSTAFVGARYLAIDVHDRDSRPPFGRSAPPDPAPAAAPAPGEPAAAANPAADPAAAAADPLAAAERMLIDQIERAADQGLIELAGPRAADQRAADPRAADPRDAPPEPAMTEIAPLPPLAPAPRPGLPAAAADDARLLAHLAATLPDHEQVEATTVFDRDSTAAAARAAAAPVPAECRGDDELDLGRWSDGRPLHDQTAAMQRRLVGEFDRPNPGPVRDLARLYIRHGFGAEAAEILRGFDVALDDGPLLADLARVVDGRPLAADGPLGRDLACPGRHGLWLAVAGRPAMLAALRHFRSLRGALEDMPPDLRGIVGPGLVRRYVEAGRPAEARILLDVVRRPGAEPTPDLRLAEGRVAAAEARLDEAEALLAGLVESNAPNAPDALAALVRARLENGGPVPARWITDLRAAAVEHRRGRREPVLRALLAEALARNGDLPGAFAALAALEADIPAAAGTVAGLAPRLLAAADPAGVGAAAYADVVLAHAGAMISAAPANDAARLKIGRELLGLGLANAALAVLDPPADREVEPARLLAARARVALDEPAAAIALIAGITGAEAASIRARALARQGDFVAATAALPAGAPAAEALPYAWAAGAWPVVKASGSPEQAAMAGWMQARGGAPLEDLPAPLTPATAFGAPLPSLDEPSLRAARALLETGREVGAFVGALLRPE